MREKLLMKRLQKEKLKHVKETGEESKERPATSKTNRGEDDEDLTMQQKIIAAIGRKKHESEKRLNAEIKDKRFRSNLQVMLKK